MSDAPEEQIHSESTLPAGSPATDNKDEKKPDRVFLVTYPKIMFLYPTVITALVCSIFMWAKGDLKKTYAEPSAAVADDDAGAKPDGDATATDKANAPAAAKSTYHNVCARIFLMVLTINLVVVSFDFPRTTSLTWFFAVVAVFIGLWALFHLNPGLLPHVEDVIFSITPAANAAFYLIFTIAMLFLFGCVLVSRRFDYWEVRGNELLHHHGVLSDLERFSAPNLRIDKEINDVFEYMLLKSGRLILHPSNERRAIVLENVLFINDKEDRITRMLGALQVRVRTDNS